MDGNVETCGCPYCGGELKFVGRFEMDGVSEFHRCTGRCRRLWEKFGGFPNVEFNDVYDELIRIREDHVAM